MATTTSKSKAKTKKASTAKKTKKPATKSKAAAAKTSAKKTTAKKTTTKKAPVAKKTAKVSKSSKSTSSARKTTARIKSTSLSFSMRLLAGLVALALAVFAYLYMSNSTADIAVDYAVADTVASRDGGVLVSASQILFSVQVKWTLIALLAVTAVFSVVYATKLKARYSAYVAYGANKLRWIETGIILGLTGELIALVSGVQSFLMLKVIFGTSLVYAFIAWLVERYHVALQTTKALYIASLLVGLIPVLAIASFGFDSMYYGELTFAWYVYVAHIAYVLAYLFIFRTQLLQIKGIQRFRSTAVIDKRYRTIQFTLVLVVSAALIAGLIQ